MEVRLSPWQTAVLDDPARFKVVNVGRRAGKTVLCVLKLLIEAGERRGNFWYVAPTYKQAKLIAWALLKEYCPPAFRPSFNETELSCCLPNGSVISLKGADNPDSLRGTRIDFAVFDEVAFFADWQKVWEALRPVLVDSQAPAWFVSTPNGFNHFYDLYNRSGTGEWKAFHYTSYDNPYVPASEIDAVRGEMDARSFAQEFMGEFSKPSGTVYAEWNVDNYKPCPYDPNLPLHVSWDFGVNDPTSMVWIQPNGSEVRVVDYYEASDPAIEHFVQVLHAKPYKTVELHTGDPAGNARELTSGISPIASLAKKGVHVRTKIVPGPDGKVIPEQIRMAHTFMPRLFVNSERCERFRDCLLNYRYPAKPSTAVNQENEVPIHDEFSHAMRAFEYWCVNVGDTHRPRERKQPVLRGGNRYTGWGGVPAAR